jgi:hypothetical protein
VEAALQSLPWVDKDTVKADVSTQQVKFKVSDKSKFSLDEVKKALPPKYQEVKVLAGPG